MNFERNEFLKFIYYNVDRNQNEITLELLNCYKYEKRLTNKDLSSLQKKKNYIN